MENNTTARIISYLFHPLLVPILICVLIFSSGHYIQCFDAKVVRAIFGSVAVFTLFFPALVLPLFYFQGSIPNLYFIKKRHRLIGLFVVLLIYTSGLLLIWRFNFPKIIVLMMLNYTIGIAILMLIQPFLKLSMHSAAWGATFGFCLYLGINFGLDLRLVLFPLILIGGIVSSCRLILKKRKPMEVYLAYLLGFLVMFFGMFIVS